MNVFMFKTDTYETKLELNFDCSTVFAQNAVKNILLPTILKNNHKINEKFFNNNALSYGTMHY